MKLKFTLFYFVFILANSVSAQNVTGIWKGYFVQNTLGYYEDRYKFEMQIEQLANSGISGVTYSYKTTVFYGKANLSGLYTNNTKVLTVTETKLLEVKVEGESEACLMTCYLEYSKMGDLETLTGTYTSRNMRNNGDCGSGKVYLEKNTASDFYKEDFLVKREYELSKSKVPQKKLPQPGSVAKAGINKQPAAPNNKPADNSNSTKPLVKNKKGVTEKSPSKKATADALSSKGITVIKPLVKPGAENNLITSSERPNNITPPSTVVITPTEPTVKPQRPTIKLIPKPDVIRKRDNELIKTYYTSAREIKIDLYDNGEIDGDTISVYDNNRLIISKKRLTDKPITYVLKSDENDPVHEFVMVAENLGSIPPNTALMIITAGDKRYELFVTSTEQKNAVVVVEYKPDHDKK